MIFEFTVDSKTNIKDFLISKRFSNRVISKLLLEKKDVYINGKEYSRGFNLNIGDVIKINLGENAPTVTPVNLPVDVIYEDDLFIVVNKPENLATIPSKLHQKDNLLGRVLNRLKAQNSPCSLHAVNRLDYLTCGIVVFAKSKYIQSLFLGLKVDKRYYAKVSPAPKEKSGTITFPIKREKENSVKRVVAEDGKKCTTVYNVIEEKDGTALVDIKLLTGRTHQIRVHFSAIGSPLVGDTLYGGRAGEFYLSAYYTSFTLPYNGKTYTFCLDKK